jgi:hypothetical protein
MAGPSFLSELGGRAFNDISSAIKQEAANSAAKAKPQPKSALQQLMDQINSINTPATPEDQLMSQATASAGAQFDPLIAQLKSQMSSTTKKAQGNEATAKQMYNDLATNIASELPGITDTFKQASDQTQQRYTDAQNQLQQQYDTQAQQQAALYQKLGIQAAGPSVSQQAADDQSYFQNQNKEDENNALNALQQEQNSDTTYNQQTVDNTKLAGNNAAQSIGSQLQDYLDQANSQLSGLDASKQGAIQSALGQLQQQDAQRVQQGNTQQYNQLMDLFNLQLKMQQMQDTEANQSQLFKGTSGPEGASNYLSGVYGNNDAMSSDIMSALNQVMGSKAATSGKYQDPTMKDQFGNPVTDNVNNQYLSAQLRKALQAEEGNQNVSSADMNNAINALYAYLGQLK